MFGISGRDEVRREDLGGRERYFDRWCEENDMPDAESLQKLLKSSNDESTNAAEEAPG